MIQCNKPVAFASKSLTDAEKRYACFERKLLVNSICNSISNSTIPCVPIWETFPGHHKPLVMILVHKPISKASPRLQHMMLKLQGYQFDIQYRPGMEMIFADTLSRLPSTQNNNPVDLDVRVDIVCFSTEHVDRMARIREASRQDQRTASCTALQRSLSQDSQKTLNMSPNPSNHTVHTGDELSVENGIILKGGKILIPESQQAEILNQLHYGHLGITKTQLRACDMVYWNNMNKDIEMMVQHCPIPQEYQPSQPKETILQHEIPNKSWEVLGTELFRFNNGEFLILADYYTKFQVIRKLPTQHTSIVVISAMKGIFTEYGVPQCNVSDKFAQFSSALF